MCSNTNPSKSLRNKSDSLLGSSSASSNRNISSSLTFSSSLIPGSNKIIFSLLYHPFLTSSDSIWFGKQLCQCDWLTCTIWQKNRHLMQPIEKCSCLICRGRVLRRRRHTSRWPRRLWGRRARRCRGERTGVLPASLLATSPGRRGAWTPRSWSSSTPASGTRRPHPSTFPTGLQTNQTRGSPVEAELKTTIKRKTKYRLRSPEGHGWAVWVSCEVSTLPGSSGSSCSGSPKRTWAHHNVDRRIRRGKHSLWRSAESPFQECSTGGHRPPGSAARCLRLISLFDLSSTDQLWSFWTWTLHLPAFHSAYHLYWMPEEAFPCLLSPHQIFVWGSLSQRARQ